MEPFIGQIQLFGFNFPPRGWTFCEGQLLPIAQNTALFSLLGTIFGGDGRTTFGLPDLRGRTVVGAGAGPGLTSIRLGEYGGMESLTLTEQQLPAHSHATSVTVNTAQGEESAPTGFLAANNGSYATAATAGQNLNGVTSQSSGGGQPANIRNPFLGLHYSIALLGVYPSRN